MDNIVIPRCNSFQMNRYMLTIAAHRTLEVIAEGIPERIDAVGANALMQSLIRGAGELSDLLLQTYPREKQETMARHAGKLCIKLEAAYAPLEDKGRTIIDMTTLGTILDHAHEECKLCSHPSRCKSCELGKAFDKCCPEERRKGESWADIDITGD